MHALTLIQPWAWAISRGGKRIENRTWPPPKWIISKRIAIHAGKKLDNDAVDDLQYWARGGTILGAKPPVGLPRHLPPVFARGAVVATALVKGYVTELGPDHPQHAWFHGPYGWVLDDVVPLEEPVPCRGYQKVWGLPREVEAAVVGQMEAA